MTTSTPTSAEREQVRAEAARLSAMRSVRWSAWAWGVLAVSFALTALDVAGAGMERSAPLVVAFAVLVVATPIAFVVLTVLAVRAAWRGLDSGYPVSRWANVLAVLDVLASVFLVISVGIAVGFVLWLSQCAADPTCQLIQF
jgi:predicted ferric reductase